MSILLTLILLLVMFLFTAAAIILVIGPLIISTWRENTTNALAIVLGFYLDRFQRPAPLGGDLHPLEHKISQ